MHDPSSADQQLLEENARLEQRILDLEQSDAEHKLAEEALRASRDYLDTILNSTGDPIFVKDSNFRFVLVNDALCTMLGIGREDIVGKTLGESLPEDQMKHFLEVDRMVLESGQENLCEEPLTGSGGKHLIIVTKKTRYVDAQGNRFVVGVIRDITESKRTEKALREARSLIESSSDAIFCVDERGQYQFTNHVFASTLGHSPEYFVGKTFWDVYPKEHADYRFAATTRVFRTGQSESLDVEVPLPTGSLFFYATANPIRDDSGNVVLVLTHGTDITDRKRTENALEEGRRLRAEIERMGKVGGWEFDIDTGTQTWTEEVYRIHEVDLSYQPTVDRGVSFYGPAYRPVIERAVQRAIEHGESFDVELEIITAKDNRRWVHAIGKADLARRKIVGFFQDVTERKRAEEDLRERVKELNCLQCITDLIGREDSLEKVFQGCAELMPDAWLYPEIACARILFDGRPYQTGNFRESDWRQSADLEVNGQPVGLIELGYLEERPIRDEGPFLREERRLINLIPEKLGRVVEGKRAEEALRKEAERLSHILEATSGGVWDWNIPTGDAVFSPGYSSMLGYTPDEFATAYKTWKALVHPDDFDRVHQEHQDHFHRNKEFSIEFRMRETSGGWHWVHSRGLVIERDDRGNPLRMVGTHSDIQERKLTEEALRASEVRHRAMFEHATHGIFQSSVEGKALAANPVFAQMLGYASEEDVLNTLTDLPRGLWAHPEERAIVRRLIEEQGHVRGYQCEFLRKDGTTIWISLNATAVRGLDGQAGYFHGSVEDITGRRQTAEALQINEERLRLAMEASKLGWFDLDVPSGKASTSPEYARILGYEPDEAAFGLQRWSDGMHPDDREGVLTIFRECIQSGDARTMEYRQCAKSGEWKWIRSTGRVVGFDADRQPLRMTGTHVDITERKRAEAKEAHLEAQLQQSQKMESVGRLAGGVAHDFNNMLGVILGHTEMAMEQVDPAQALHADLEEVHKAATRSVGLTRQLLAFARKQTIVPRVLDLNDIVAQALTMLGRLVGEDIHLVWQPVADLWPVKVDPSQIDQILTNLLVNARDAITDVGTVTIETANATIDAGYCADHVDVVPGEYVRVIVSDSGCGMDQATQAHVFEPFFTTKELGKGTGLGLATVYGIVKQNQGFIHVYSEPGHGTTFTISLPRYQGQADPAHAAGAAAPTLRGSETILLVEDEPAILELTARMLERQGYTVLAAATPGEAIRVAANHPSQIHLLMTDVVMPEMNGRDLATHLLALHPKIEPLFMSGYTANVIAHHGVLEEGVSFIQKPFSVSDLAAKVRETLDRKESAS